MQKLLSLCLLALCVSCGAKESQVIKNDLRLPAYPLVTIDPYTSAWSYDDNLYDGQVKHRSTASAPHELVGALRVDGTVYRFMGLNEAPKRSLMPQSYEEPWSGNYTFEKPTAGWEKPEFDDSSWKSGEAAFGTKDEQNVKTLWNTGNIWVRRQLKLDPATFRDNKLYVIYSHDDAFTLYVNGIKLADTGYKWDKDVAVELTPEIMETMKDGNVTIAAHCENRMGGGLVDFGIYAEDVSKVSLEQTAVQTSVDVQATQTYYTFDCGDVQLKLTFLAPFLMDDIDLMARPVNYISYDVVSLDGQPHDVQLYFEASPNWTTLQPNQVTTAEGYEKEGMLYLKTGKADQQVLGKTNAGSVRTNWGYLYMSADKDNATYAVGDPVDMRDQFVKNGALSGDVAVKNKAYISISENLGNTREASGKVMIGFDDIYSLHYFGDNLRPYWNRNGDRLIEDEFVAADKNFAKLKRECTKFDYDLMTKAIEVGGKEYADLCASVYRQVIAAHKLMESPDGTLLFPSKELSSGGFVSTVDVTYPSAPMFLYYNPDLLKALMEPVFYYSESGKWIKPYPAHDVGRYPWAVGQDYGEDMPVEEAGNMLILTAAIAKVEGNAEFARKHWDVLTTWAKYLEEKGLDPDNQLCTDDFAGHLARNANLSVKAIMGVASYGYLAAELNHKDISEDYLSKAREMAGEWIKLADGGDHYSLAFGRPDTWSQKYNMVWDKLMGWNLFPQEVADKELAYYLTKQNIYGLPLDSRQGYTKSDWVVWTATWTAQDKETFGKLISPIYKFANETVDRQPMSDWHSTLNGHKIGFWGRPVMGGYYIKMLEEKMQK